MKSQTFRGWILLSLGITLFVTFFGISVVTPGRMRFVGHDTVVMFDIQEILTS